MTRQDRVLGIIGEIYDAAGSPDKWTACLASINELLQGSAGFLLYHNHASHDGGVQAAASADPAALQAYDEYYHQVDPWAFQLNAAAMVPGQLLTGESIVSHRDVLKTEYYADFARSFGLTRVLVGVLDVSSSNGGTIVSVVSVNRADSGREFGAGDARILGVLVPHLRRALAFHRRLTKVDTERARAADVIDRLTIGVILLDAALQPVLVNRAASNILAKRDGLTLERGVLRAGTAQLTTVLRRSIEAAIAVTREGAIGVEPAALSLPRPSGRRPFQVFVTPLVQHNEYAGKGVNAVAAAFITDPDRVAIPDQDVLRHLYGLTPVEARVASALAQGQRVEHIAESMRLTRQTARWYVKQVLHKTGTSTQAQFVRAVLSSPAIVR